MLPRDLKEIVQSPEFRRRWSEALEDHGVSGLDASELDIGYVRFKPSVGCLLGLRTATDEFGPGYLKIFFNGDGEACFDKYRAREKGEGWVEWMPEFRAVYFHFPMDRSVVGLPSLADPQRLKHVLHESVAELHPQGERVRARKSRVNVLRYKPERRCIVRADLATRDAAGRKRSRKLVAQAYADDSGEAVFHAMEHARQLGADSRALRIPRAFGYHRTRRVLVQEWVAGESLGLRLVRESAPRECRLAARALRDLHSLPCPYGLTTRTPTDELNDALRVLEDIARVGEAGLVELSARLARELRRARIDEIALAPSLLHGDFYYHQFLVAPDAFTLIDWDEAHLGDRRVDVGNFLAHLHLVDLDGRLDSAAARDLRSEFLDEYLFDRRELRGVRRFTSLQLAKLASVPFRNLRDDWRERTERILERSLEILAAAGVVS